MEDKQIKDLATKFAKMISEAIQEVMQELKKDDQEVIPEWQQGKWYENGDVVKHEDEYFVYVAAYGCHCNNPPSAPIVESLWDRLDELPEDVCPDMQEEFEPLPKFKGRFNPSYYYYDKGDIVESADGHLFESQEELNGSPLLSPAWKKIRGGSRIKRTLKRTRLFILIAEKVV